MKKQEILNGIVRELESLVLEKPKDFYYAIDCYADDYNDDSIGALIRNWGELGFGNFGKMFPLTSKLYTELENMNDGTEKSIENYVAVISLAKDALNEINNYGNHIK